MSLSPYFFVEKWNAEKNCYEEINLYKKLSKHQWAMEEDKARGFEEVDFWPWNGTHEIFAKLGTVSKDLSYDPIAGVHSGVPPMVSETVKKKIDEFFDESEPREKENTVRWVTLADLYIEKLTSPKVVDYEAEWEDPDNKVYKDNPIQDVIDRINTWVSLGNDDWGVDDDKSLIRIVYWVVW